ncbi:hypothetical protein QBC34DRAFT_405959 [Podospora aff. communis PSN243]|uniref:Uncharacterized protein n=1 Tax=Podospora aff. communis PSN243 TaxID=3040156 RepID=A0AAV9GMY8_9PEZI|nr:hypothetical protein QBC34DRAFT_405959 [Podospora aff. communis PSN243]
MFDSPLASIPVEAICKSGVRLSWPIRAWHRKRGQLDFPSSSKVTLLGTPPSRRLDRKFPLITIIAFFLRPRRVSSLPLFWDKHQHHRLTLVKSATDLIAFVPYKHYANGQTHNDLIPQRWNVSSSPQQRRLSSPRRITQQQQPPSHRMPCHLSSRPGFPHSHGGFRWTYTPATATPSPSPLGRQTYSNTLTPAASVLHTSLTQLNSHDLHHSPLLHGPKAQRRLPTAAAPPHGTQTRSCDPQSQHTHLVKTTRLNQTNPTARDCMTPAYTTPQRRQILPAQGNRGNSAMQQQQPALQLRHKIPSSHLDWTHT